MVAILSKKALYLSNHNIYFMDPTTFVYHWMSEMAQISKIVCSMYIHSNSNSTCLRNCQLELWLHIFLNLVYTVNPRLSGPYLSRPWIIKIAKLANFFACALHRNYWSSPYRSTPGQWWLETSLMPCVGVGRLLEGKI